MNALCSKFTSNDLQNSVGRNKPKFSIKNNISAKSESCIKKRLSEWTVEEKKQLLYGLNKYGLNKMESIMQEIPLKTLSEINVMIARYERLANYDPDDRYDRESPIDRWTEIMRKNTDYSELSPVSKALKYIALFEERKQDGVNLKDIYEMLANASQGIAPKQLDKETAAFLYDTLTKVAKAVKKEDNTEAFEFLKNVKLQSNNITKTYTYSNKTKREHEDSAVNPLKVPKELHKRRKK